MEMTADSVKRLEKTSAYPIIQVMLGRYATLMDQMNFKDIYEELFACDNPEVSIEYTDLGRYDGPEHVRAFVDHYHSYLQDYSSRHGWLDFVDAGTPEITVSEDGTHAFALWTMFGPKAKEATPDGMRDRVLTAFWYGGKMRWELIKVDGQWKILHFHLATYFTAPYEKGWVEQQECFREPPLWTLLPDRDLRFYVYKPDCTYVQGGLYNWGPFIPKEGTF